MISGTIFLNQAILEALGEHCREGFRVWGLTVWGKGSGASELTCFTFGGKVLGLQGRRALQRSENSFGEVFKAS